jgi:hypothetical protein
MVEQAKLFLNTLQVLQTLNMSYGPEVQPNLQILAFDPYGYSSAND